MYQNILRLGKQDFPSIEKVQVLGMVVNHNISANTILATAKNHLLPRYKREKLIQPGVFFG